jgi:hypothetical protein
MPRATKLSARTVKVALWNVGDCSSTVTLGRPIMSSMPACACASKLMSIADEPSPSSRM